jgi:hypothetical protein
MKTLENLLFVALILQLYSCHSDTNNKVKSSFEANVPATLEPPPPPFHPYPFQPVKTEHLKFIYGDKLVDFNASLSTNRVFMLNDTDVQTFSIYAKTDVESDSFYFVLPAQLTKFWDDVTITKSDNEFIVGYENKEKQFVQLYRIYLGEYNLNKDRIFMEYISKGE